MDSVSLLLKGGGFWRNQKTEDWENVFVYLTFFLPSEYFCTPSVEENSIQLPFSTPTNTNKNPQAVNLRILFILFSSFQHRELPFRR